MIDVQSFKLIAGNSLMSHLMSSSLFVLIVKRVKVNFFQQFETLEFFFSTDIRLSLRRASWADDRVVFLFGGLTSHDAASMSVCSSERRRQLCSAAEKLFVCGEIKRATEVK